MKSAWNEEIVVMLTGYRSFVHVKMPATLLVAQQAAEVLRVIERNQHGEVVVVLNQLRSFVTEFRTCFVVHSSVEHGVRWDVDIASLGAELAEKNVQARPGDRSVCFTQVLKLRCQLS